MESLILPQFFSLLSFFPVFFPLFFSLYTDEVGREPQTNTQNTQHYLSERSKSEGRIEGPIPERYGCCFVDISLFKQIFSQALAWKQLKGKAKLKMYFYSLGFFPS